MEDGRNDGIGVLPVGSDQILSDFISEVRKTPQGSSPFLDTSDVSWIRELELAYPVIRVELERVMKAASILPGLEDIQTGQHVLTHDGRWKIFPFVAYGQWAEANARRCPSTAAALKAVPGLLVAMFSILSPAKIIPPHVGNYCGILRFHLPLIIPEPSLCGISVGNEVRHWEAGRGLLFDDTYLHSAWNRSDYDRTILLIDVVRPIPERLAIKNLEIIEMIGRSDSVTSAHRRWEEWENWNGTAFDRILSSTMADVDAG